ncbi:MAG TPA: WXG100 family type VII secretion target, partial [Nitrospirales bacterium]|nr:WXG100 family type VII secretion target [Nitrospirales bacterium]
MPTAFPADWLQAQEAFGGHTVARHVGKTDEWLVNRLSKSSRISAASTYPNAETATTHIQAALTAKTAMLNQWVRDAPAGATL